MRSNSHLFQSVVLVFLVTGTGCQTVRDRELGRNTTMEIDNTQAKFGPKQTADMQVALGRSLEMHGNTQQAMEAYAEAVRNDHSRADALARMAVSHDKQGQFQQSAELYRLALQADPGNPELFCDRGYSLYLQRRFNEAEMNLRQAIALKPGLARAHNNLGLLLAHTNRPDLALVEFQQAGCSRAEQLSNLAFCLAVDGRLPEARQNYQLALTADPASAAARMGLRQLDTLSPMAKQTSPMKMADQVQLANFDRPNPQDSRHANPPRSSTSSQPETPSEPVIILTELQGSPAVARPAEK